MLWRLPAVTSCSMMFTHSKIWHCQKPWTESVHSHSSTAANSLKMKNKTIRNLFSKKNIIILFFSVSLSSKVVCKLLLFVFLSPFTQTRQHSTSKSIDSLHNTVPFSLFLSVFKAFDSSRPLASWWQVERKLPFFLITFWLFPILSFCKCAICYYYFT